MSEQDIRETTAWQDLLGTLENEHCLDCGCSCAEAAHWFEREDMRAVDKAIRDALDALVGGGLTAAQVVAVRHLVEAVGTGARLEATEWPTETTP